MENYHEIKIKKRIGLIGYPISHSFSPKMFYDNFMDCQDVLDRYSYDLIETSDFDKAMTIFKDDYYAVNVTLPFKVRAYGVADQFSNICRWIGASNLLVKENGGIKAYNSDYFAVFDILRREIPHEMVPKTKVLVIGCGGAGKAAVAACLKLGFITTIMNRTISTCEDYKKHLHDNNFSNAKELDRIVGMDNVPKEVADADIIIYTLPVAIRNLGSLDFSGKIVIEANYRNPSFTPSIIGKSNMRYIGGTEWLRLEAEATYRLIIF